MMDGCKDLKEREFEDEVANREKQLWVLVNSKGLFHPDVRNLYHRLCSSYETIILQNLELSQLQDIEYSLWKLHYKHIDEFRKRRNNNPLDIANIELFLSDASHFYTNLLIQLQSKWIPTTSKWRILSHRFYICLGDLARYKELFTKPEVDKNKDWSVAARHYSEACFTCPDSGNPHNQLALLATYVGDDFLALYHFVRSLAAKEPFLDSSNNLMLILEKSRSCSDDEAPFDFLQPHRRMNPLIKEGQSCKENEVWPRLVRMMSFFYTKPCRLQEFPIGFSATIRHLDMLMELDDKRLEEALMNPYSTNCVHTRAIQAVCIFIFLIQNFLSKPVWTNNSCEKVKKEDDPMLRVYAFCSAFIFMGRLVDRCTSSSFKDSPFSLLPSVLIFMEWLVTVFDQVKSASSTFSSEEEKASLSYFVGSLGLLLKRLENDGICEIEFQHSFSSTTTLCPEDFELRGFSPMAPVHESFDFSSTSSGSMFHRTYRTITAAKRIIGDFIRNSDMKCNAASATGEEEEEEEKEVILFKPLTRYNSAPIHNKEGGVVVSHSTIGGSDEVLRRATSMVSPQNHNPAVVVKGKESPISISRDVGSPMAAGPPSLSAWVIDGVGIQEMSKACCFSPIKEIVPKLSMNDDEDSGFSIPTNYSAPIPSAPLLPEDAAWFNGNEVDVVENTQPLPPPPPPPPQDNNNLYYSTDLSSSSLNDVVVYPISCGMSSSEWLQQFREMNNLNGNGRPRLLLGNFDSLSRTLQYRSGRILGDQQTDYLPIHPPLPDIYQKPSPTPYGTDDQLQQYLKDTQLRWLQQDPSFHT